MRFVITGATGLLGRNLLFEILKQNLNCLDDLEVFVLGRRYGRSSVGKYVENILVPDGYDYIGLKDKSPIDLRSRISSCIIPMSFDLNDENLGMLSDDYGLLKSKKIDYFFHLAALSDFRDTPIIKARIFDTNVEGTKRLLQLVKTLSLREFIYAGSAYSAGFTLGEVFPDYINDTNEFRNPYEESKLKAELYIKAFANEIGLRYRIFRLTGIGGRLIEQPIGSICKYDIFYGWALFFLKQKLKYNKKLKDMFTFPLSLPMRIAINFKSGMNVVPVDYAAKLILATCINNDDNISYHLVNDIDIPNSVHTKLMLKALNIKEYVLVNEEPKDKNLIEKLYYKTVGRIFTPYVITDPIYYNHDNLDAIRKKAGLICPPMDEENFAKLVGYAVENNFGLTGQ
ncbi:MAG: SDR family oxidoreductase [Candidatus Margulisiibacteriota bacterium]